MSREFWLSEYTDLTKMQEVYLTLEKVDDECIRVREADPAYDAAVAGLVEALTYAECHCKYKVGPSGNERTHECKRCAAFAAWERVNEGK